MQFFDKMKEKVAPALSDAGQKLKVGVDQVVAGAGEKLQETRLKSQLRSLQKERAEKLQALGLRAHELHKGEGIGVDDLTAELAEVDEVDVRIAAKLAEIEAAPEA